MQVRKEKNGTELTVYVEGRLTSDTAPVLEAALADEYPDITKLYFDFSELNYISSAGLRILLDARHRLRKYENVVVINANQEIEETFEITGFIDVICFKQEEQ